MLGTTGAGKSSLMHLIPRLYGVTSGKVSIDGCDIRDIDRVTLRRNIGVALQEAVLFSGTIRDNIRYGRPDAIDEEVIAAAKAAQACRRDTIRSLDSAASIFRVNKNNASPSPALYCSDLPS